MADDPVKPFDNLILGRFADTFGFLPLGIGVVLSWTASPEGSLLGCQRAVALPGLIEMTSLSTSGVRPSMCFRAQGSYWGMSASSLSDQGYPAALQMASMTSRVLSE